MKKHPDITIFYFGASGGFFLLYMLLLTKQYRCVFKDGSVDAFSNRLTHWNISDVSKWKDTEIWPDNGKTLVAKFDTHKVYFVCNPDPLFLTKPGIHDGQFEKLPSTKILLYTDLATQWNLAKTKRAYWFQQGRDLDGSGPVWQTDEFMEGQFRIRYDNVKQPEWPDCATSADFYSLPKHIQDTCINDHHFWEVLDYAKFDSPDYKPRGVEYNNEIVYKRAVDFMSQVDIVVKLQDVIKTKGSVLFDQLGITSSAEIAKFLVQYLSLHTVEQRGYLLGKT
jgi:hypothetical protein